MLNCACGILQRLRSAVPLLSILLATFQSAAALSSKEDQTSSAKTWQTNNPVWRGVHLGLHNDQQTEALLEQLPKLSKLGVNVLVVEVNYAFDYQSHPEIRPGQYITKARARELVTAARKHSINVIPQIN
jgi:endo-alpha-1,4-polygalactosaminidase (GH114 family)